MRNDNNITLRDNAISSHPSSLKISWPVRIWRFYVDGFKSMTIGKTLWTIIIIKLFVMFFILKLFFFPNILNRDYDNDADRAKAVRENLCNPNN